MSGRSSERYANKRGPRREPEMYLFRDEAGAEELLLLALGAAMVGAAVRIGLTRDGGAIALGMYHGGDYGTEYIRPGDDLEAEVHSIAQAWSIPMAFWDDEAQQYMVP